MKVVPACLRKVGNTNSIQKSAIWETAALMVSAPQEASALDSEWSSDSAGGRAISLGLSSSLHPAC